MFSTSQMRGRQICYEANDFGPLQVLKLILFALIGPILGTEFRNGRTVSNHLKGIDGKTDSAASTPPQIKKEGFEVYKYVDHEKLAKRIEEAARKWVYRVPLL